MNVAIFRALLLDALYQVLDNKVFRLLVLATLVPIALSFLVGFREEEIVFFFGLKTFDYNAILGFIGQPDMDGSNLRIRAIQGMQSLLVENLSGNIGILACIAATSFFVPRMLERGTADTLFSKPLSRATLLLARYLSGILFVFLLASFLMVGVHAGLTIVSGYSDPGFLWGALTLTYVFALVHSFSTCVAAVTRSSTAAILCTLAFFVFTGCTHGLWIGKERAQALALTQDGTESAEGDERRASGPNFDDPWIKRLVTALDIAHYTLPKTTDADALTSLLRRSIEGDPNLLTDMTGGLQIHAAPSFGAKANVQESRAYQDDAQSFDLSWTQKDSDGSEISQLRLQRFHRRHETLEDGSQGSALEKSFGSSSHRRIRKKELATLEGASAIAAIRGRVASRSASFVRWSQDTPGGSEGREEIAFGYGVYTYLISSRWKTAGLPADERELRLDEFLDGLSFPALDETLTADKDTWLQKKLSFSAPLKFNILFSIGSSIAFALAMLFVSWLALRRINF